ncbi:tetratricopeptide repeat protein [Rodentibacter caecimuris]|uniref:tetratricopeptide repeat protein n=1 Tax=Rodentibacter caecimuris TaxID=1796644 RepID=UPI001094B798|nr:MULTISPECIES: SEL1-like repeat protein [Pasteurellaceae]MCX2962429.1 SEL1-like repeat protein [Rodentibacter heylii]QIA75977.1 SEL1-like repeat protein [Rodentibacter heylii]TGY46276.1 hypothetical protein E5343_12345 [Pasteurella caecimuris]
MRKFYFTVTIGLFSVPALFFSNHSLSKVPECKTLVTKDIQDLSYCATKDDLFSQYNLAVIYRDGIGTKVDLEKSFYWFNRSAKLGFTKSKANLSWFYKNGVVVEKNYDKAFYWAEQAAKENNPIGLNNLGVYYQNGIGTNRDFKKAIDYFNQALLVDNQLPITKINLANSYFYGLGVEKDINKAIKLAKEAAGLGDVMGMNNLGFYYKELGDNTQSFKWIKKGAEAGGSLAQANLGFYYAKGIGTIPDKEQALYWLNKSIAQNETQAYFLLATLFSEGNSIVQQDDKQAFEYYKKAAEMGHGLAQNNLANWLFNGRYVKRNEEEAIKWLQKAANENNIVVAMFALSQIYSNGSIDTPQDLEKAKYWLEKAKENGFTFK